MLVLSRQRDETIMIGNDIELTVVDIRGDKVRLGIKAPSHIAVHRKEVYDAIKRENEEAAHLSNSELPNASSSMSGTQKPSASIPAAGRVKLQDSSRRKESA
ncbi:MAG: carbon storage regulator CsrA [Planctomycetota bacterium]|nr:carbon storage regulator CsrA [Planctomycetota bacterium]